MNTVTPAVLNLARRLIALEGARPSPNLPCCDAVQACDKLRTPLTKLAGVAGFRSLMARALVLATAEKPWLKAVSVHTDGCLHGFDEARRQQPAPHDVDGGVAIVAQLLGLLVTFIGDSLTMRLVRDAWPGEQLDEIAPSGEGQS